jgi:hypothetical protein
MAIVQFGWGLIMVGARGDGNELASKPPAPPVDEAALRSAIRSIHGRVAR